MRKTHAVHTTMRRHTCIGYHECAVEDSLNYTTLNSPEWIGSFDSNAHTVQHLLHHTTGTGRSSTNSLSCRKFQWEQRRLSMGCLLFGFHLHMSGIWWCVRRVVREDGSWAFLAGMRSVAVDDNCKADGGDSALWWTEEIALLRTARAKLRRHRRVCLVDQCSGSQEARKMRREKCGSFCRAKQLD